MNIINVDMAELEARVAAAVDPYDDVYSELATRLELSRDEVKQRALFILYTPDDTLDWRKESLVDFLERKLRA